MVTDRNYSEYAPLPATPAKLAQARYGGEAGPAQQQAQIDIIGKQLSDIDGLIARLSGQVSLLCGPWPEEPEKQPEALGGVMAEFEQRLRSQYRCLSTLTDVLGRVVNA